MVKVPFPVHPELPVSAHVPVMVFPATAPERVRLLPPGDPDSTFIPNLPATLPLKSPLSANDPLSVSPETKHGELVLNPKLLMLRLPLVDSTMEVLKAKACVLCESIKVAVQFPLMLPPFLLLVPQPISAMPNTSKLASVIFIEEQLL